MTRMRQIWITKRGGPEVLQVREAPDPAAGPGEIRVRVKAAGINFADLMARMGVYPDAPPLPCVVGYEASGVIDQIGPPGEQIGPPGEDQSRDRPSRPQPLAVGDRVFAMPKFGGYTDTLVVPAAQAMRMPDQMSFHQGAALPVVYITAHHMLLVTGNLRRGARVLIHSAAGGVGRAAIQIARTRGCVILGTASPGKHELLRQAGCQHPIDSALTGAALQARVREILQTLGGPAAADGLDVVLDPVGGPSWTDGYQLLGQTGRLVAFGFSSLTAGRRRSLLHAAGRILKMKWGWSPLALMDDNKAIAGVNIGHLFARLDLMLPQLDELLAMYQRGEIEPHVDRTFTFDQAAEAHHYLHDRKARGKVLLVPEPEATTA
jgi:NADPH:quinone reductase-like Zn-dependent oxidoreductase